MALWLYDLYYMWLKENMQNQQHIPLAPSPNFIWWKEVTNFMCHHVCLRSPAGSGIHLTLEDHKMNNISAFHLWHETKSYPQPKARAVSESRAVILGYLISFPHVWDKEIPSIALPELWSTLSTSVDFCFYNKSFRIPNQPF